jgi:dATP pyrophosphohydrolase
LAIPEYAFAVELPNDTIKLSGEHTKYEWVDYSTAIHRLKYDSNKVALWELDNKNQSGYSGSASLLAHNLKATSDKGKLIFN